MCGQIAARISAGVPLAFRGSSSPQAPNRILAQSRMALLGKFEWASQTGAASRTILCEAWSNSSNQAQHTFGRLDRALTPVALIPAPFHPDRPANRPCTSAGGKVADDSSIRLPSKPAQCTRRVRCRQVIDVEVIRLVQHQISAHQPQHWRDLPATPLALGRGVR
jgi:hypothetical protein